jgi:hypothetical protein
MAKIAQRGITAGAARNKRLLRVNKKRRKQNRNRKYKKRNRPSGFHKLIITREKINEKQTRVFFPDKNAFSGPHANEAVHLAPRAKITRSG